MSKLKKKKILLNNEGIALVICLSLIAMITMLTLTFMSTSLAEIQATERFENRTVTFHLAEGAVDQTIVALRSNRNYSGVPSTSASNGRISGTYQTTVTQSQNNSNLFQIQAIGSVSATGGAYSFQQRTINAVVDLTPAPPFSHALFANQTISMSGNARTNSYNSSNGPYNSSFTTNNGHIGTNGAGGNVISLSGNTRIGGNAIVGPNANINTAIVRSGNATILGNRLAASSLKTLTPVTIPSNLTSSGSLSISGNNTVTLPSGTYWYSSISISGNGRLNLSGPTTIYIDGTVNISGNGFGTAQNLPPNLTINVQGNRNILITGNGNLYGTIYAPQSAISISDNGHIFGSIISNTIAISGNGNIHYDQALNQSSSSSYTSGQLKSWSET